MGKNGFTVAAVIGLLLLFLAIFRRKKSGSEFDGFFSDAEVVNNLEEHEEPTVVPASLLGSTVDSGNGNTECEQSGYMSFTFPNPTPFPITLDIVNPQNYYQTLQNYETSQLNTNTNYAIGGSLIGSVFYNNLIYSVNQNSPASVYIFNPSTNSLVTNLSIAPNTLSVTDGVRQEPIVYNNLLIVPGYKYVTIIDVNPTSTTYNQIIANLFCGASVNTLNAISVFGNNIYVTYSGSVTIGLIKINLSSLTITGNFLLSVASNISSSFPNYKLGQSTSRYIYLFALVSTNVIVFDTNTDTILVTSTATHVASAQACVVGNNLYIPQTNNIDIFSTISNTVVGTINIAPKQGSFAIFNNRQTVYITIAGGGVLPINTNTNTASAIIATGFISGQTIINRNLLYAADSFGSQPIAVIDTDESSPTFNQIISTIATGIGGLDNPILASSSSNVNVLFTAQSGTVSSSIISVPTTDLTSQVQINLNNMANMQQNPGEICGIFYRSLTVAQMSNVFQVNWNDATGATDSYKLIPITYKDTMSMLNQIYVSKFFRPIVINNSLNFYHVINPGENVYVKIYVRTFVNNVTLLETGEIEATETGTGAGSIYNADKQYGDQLQQEEEEREADWMDVEEVEEGVWGDIHIECPEDEEENVENEEEYEEIQ